MNQIENHQSKVGLFVTVGIATVLFSILLLGGGSLFFTKHTVLYAKLKHVQGLNEGSVVSLSGLNIGNVKSIDFSDDNNNLLVTLKIESKYLARISETSTAEIRTQGALGDKFVYISPGDSSSPTMKEGSILMAAKNSDLMGVISEKGGEAAKIFDIITELHKLVLSLNYQDRTGTIMNNLSDATANLKQTSLEAQKLIRELRLENPEKIREVIGKMDSIMTKIDRGQGTLGALINDSTLHEQLKAMLGGNSRKAPIQNLIRTSIEKPQ
jgi:phospholipid/cholesterol/gamma-HCH transport system substrate-binding protein